jgi:hypothetical protein
MTRFLIGAGGVDNGGCPAKENQRENKFRPRPFIRVSNLLSDEWLTSPSVIPLYSFLLIILFPRPT